MGILLELEVKTCVLDEFVYCYCLIVTYYTGSSKSMGTFRTLESSVVGQPNLGVVLSKILQNSWGSKFVL